MEIPFKELLQLSNNHNKIWPEDLVEDLEEEDPIIAQQSQLYKRLILERLHREEENNETFLEDQKEAKIQAAKPQLPSLVVSGWNNPNIKGKKNWADFENLLLFYTIGKLAKANTPENRPQKERDLSELRTVIEAFLPLKGQKSQTAEKRVEVETTYLAFGKKVIDSLVKNDCCSQYELQREIQDAEETNSFNASKLHKSYTIACRIFKNLQRRYP